MDEITSKMTPNPRRVWCWAYAVYHYTSKHISQHDQVKAEKARPGSWLVISCWVMLNAFSGQSIFWLCIRSHIRSACIEIKLQENCAPCLWHNHQLYDKFPSRGRVSKVKVVHNQQFQQYRWYGCCNGRIYHGEHSQWMCSKRLAAHIFFFDKHDPYSQYLFGLETEEALNSFWNDSRIQKEADLHETVV